MYLISSGDGSERGGWDITGTLVFLGGGGGGDGCKNGLVLKRGMGNIKTKLCKLLEGWWEK